MFVMLLMNGRPSGLFIFMMEDKYDGKNNFLIEISLFNLFI